MMISDQRIAELAKDVAAHLSDEYGTRNLVVTFAEQAIRTAVRETQEACAITERDRQFWRMNEELGHIRSVVPAEFHKDKSMSAISLVLALAKAYRSAKS